MYTNSQRLSSRLLHQTNRNSSLITRHIRITKHLSDKVSLCHSHCNIPVRLDYFNIIAHHRRIHLKAFRRHRTEDSSIRRLTVCPRSSSISRLIPVPDRVPHRSIPAKRLSLARIPVHIAHTVRLGVTLPPVSLLNSIAIVILVPGVCGRVAGSTALD